jgi:Putative peptidoglycan binding domain
MKPIYLLFLLYANTAFAQSKNSEYERVEIREETMDFSGIKNPDSGERFAQCQIADEYQTIVPANWRTRPPDTVFYKTHRIGWKLIIPPLKPEQIETHRVKLYDAYPIYFLKGSTVNSKKSILKKTKNGIITLLPPVYQVRGKEVEVHRDTIEHIAFLWERGDANCLSQNPNDCFQLRLTGIPELSVLFYQKKLQTRPRIITAKKDTTELPFNSPFLDSLIVPARYADFHYNRFNIKELVYKKIDTVTTKVMIYRDSTRKVMVWKGGWSEWKKVLCGYRIAPAPINEVQISLAFLGYYFGKIDNILGPQTKKALVTFQKDNGLPIGSLDLQTLKALNIGAFRNNGRLEKIRNSDIINAIYPEYRKLTSSDVVEFKNMGFSEKELRRRGFL